MPRGEIRFFHERKPYGFISCNKTLDVFFHASDFESKSIPKEGMDVTFDIKYGSRGPRGMNVTPIKDSEQST